jgi:hypothetical protein
MNKYESFSYGKFTITNLNSCLYVEVSGEIYDNDQELGKNEVFILYHFLKEWLKSNGELSHDND